MYNKSTDKDTLSVLLFLSNFCSKYVVFAIKILLSNIYFIKTPTLNKANLAVFLFSILTLLLFMISS